MRVVKFRAILAPNRKAVKTITATRRFGYADMKPLSIASTLSPTLPMFNAQSSATSKVIFKGRRCFNVAVRRMDYNSHHMQGNPKVIAELNSALKEELTAISQYFLHAEMCENWKYDKLGDFIKKQSIDEMKHAEALIERILFLDGAPNLTELLHLSIGQNVREQLQNDLNLETNAVAQYNASIKIAVEAGDNASRELFERLLKDEESHVDWLEAQLHQIKEIGYERYLSQQIREEK